MRECDVSTSATKEYSKPKVQQHTLITKETVDINLFFLEHVMRVNESAANRVAVKHPGKILGW
jgi:hypothetical protein